MSLSLLLPNPPPQWLPAWAAQLCQSLTSADAQNFKRGQDVDLKGSRLFLYDSAGGRWRITVSTSGAITATAA